MTFVAKDGVGDCCFGNYFHFEMEADLFLSRKICLMSDIAIFWMVLMYHHPWQRMRLWMHILASWVREASSVLVFVEDV